MHQVLGEVADLLGVHAGMHALRQARRGAVGGDTVLAVAHLLAQLGGTLVQPPGGMLYGAVLRRVLVS